MGDEGIATCAMIARWVTMARSWWIHLQTE